MELASILIEERYNILKARGGQLDIGEHLETLMLAASNVSSVLELGVRGAVSTAAFAEGLKRYRLSHLDESKPRLVSCDLIRSPEFDKLESLYTEFIDFSFFEGDCLTYPLDSDTNFDIIFYDTFHCMGQNVKELAKFAHHANKLQIWHDTTGDWENSEIIREPWAWNINNLVSQGWTYEEVTKGLRYAIEPFLLEHSDTWKQKIKYENNNGLLICERISS